VSSPFQVFCFYLFEAIYAPGVMTLLFVGNDCLMCLDSGKNSSFFLGLRKMLLKEGILKRQRCRDSALLCASKGHLALLQNGWK